MRSEPTADDIGCDAGRRGERSSGIDRWVEAGQAVAAKGLRGLLGTEVQLAVAPVLEMVP